MNEIDFPAAIQAVTGSVPIPRQTALSERFYVGRFPTSRNLPSGVEKTSVMPVWPIALPSSPEYRVVRAQKFHEKVASSDQTCHNGCDDFSHSRTTASVAPTEPRSRI